MIGTGLVSHTEMLIKPKVILVCMFEPEKGPAGEFGLFRDREKMQPLEMSGLDGVWATPDKEMLGVLAGVGTANTAISITSLGLNPAFDLSHTFWLVAGIAGGNPNRCSLGSPVWADWCVDADLAFEIDSREIPDDWSTGILPLGAKEPFGTSSMPMELFGHPYQMFQLFPALWQRAYSLCTEIELVDSPALAELRRGYEEIPGASVPPVLRSGATLSGARFWHGPRHNAWAERWVQHWTGGCGDFFTSAMEDTGTLHALARLGEMERVDPRRSLILRTVSNFTMPADGSDVVASLTGDSHGGEFPAHAIALENSYRAASVVYKNIIANTGAWEALL